MNANLTADLGLQLHAVMPNYEYLMFGIIYILLPLMAVIHIIRSRHRGAGNKIIWFLVVVLLPVAGAALYMMAGRAGRTISTHEAIPG